MKSSSLPNCRPSPWVLCRYKSTLSAANWWAGPGLVKNRANLDAANAISGLVLTAVYRIDPIFLWYRDISNADAMLSLGNSSINPISV